MARKRDVIVRIGADSSELDARVAAAGKRLDDLGAMGRKAGAALAAGFAVATVAAGALIKSGLEAIDAQAKLSRSVGGTIDGLRGLQIAGGDAGVKLDTVNDAAYKLAARLGDIQRQGGPAGKILADLGLNAAELANLDVDKRFAAIADAMAEAGLSAAQQADALRQLGIEQKEVVQLFMGGGDAIRAARDEVERFGLAVSEIDAAKIEAANDAMSRIGRSLEGVRNQLAIASAPFLEEISERLTEAVGTAGGFREATTEAAEAAGTSLAKVADIAQGLRVVLKGAELIVVGFSAAMVSSAQIAAEAFTAFADSAIRSANFATSALNKLPGVDIPLLEVDVTESEFMQSFRRMGEELRNQVGETRAELHDMAMQPLPSAGVERFFADVRARAQEAAEAIVAARNEANMAGLDGFGTGQVGTPANDATAREAEERQREALEGRLQILREHYMSETELELQRYAEQLNLLQDAEDMRITSVDELYALREQAEAEHQLRMTGIVDAESRKRAEAERRAMSMTVDSLVKGLGQAFNAISSSNKKRFEQAKAFAKAEASLNAFRAIQQVWADEQLPFYAKIAATAVTALQTAANISAINATQFGGGTTPSAAGTPTVNGAPVAAASAPQGPQRAIFVTLQGETQSTSSVRELLTMINDTIGDGGQLVLTPG